MKNAPNSRTFLYLALVLVFIGIVTEVIAKNRDASATGALARATADRSYPSVDVGALIRTADELHFAGLVSVLLGVLLAGVSAYRKEQLSRPLRVLLIAMLALYLSLMFIAV